MAVKNIVSKNSYPKSIGILQMPFGRAIFIFFLSYLKNCVDCFISKNCVVLFYVLLNNCVVFICIRELFFIVLYYSYDRFH